MDFSVNRIMQLVGAVIVLVAFSVLMPTIISSIVDAQNTSGIDNFSGVSQLLGLVPLVAVVGGVAIAGLIAVSALRNRNDM